MRSRINPKHIAQSGLLTHFHVDRLLIAIRTPSEVRKVLHVRFHRDGSIFVQFPYFHRTNGVVKELVFPDGRGLPATVDFGREASITSHLVKFAHHIDGEVHFSQDGKVLTRVRRRSFPLNGPIGHLFQLTAVDLSGFQEFGAADGKVKRPSIEFVYPGMPAAVNIVGDWMRKAMFQRLIERSTGGPAGPVLTLSEAGTTETQDWVVCAPPLQGRVSEHVLAIRCSRAEPIAGLDEPSIIFVGGWDQHEATSISDTVHHSGALFCMYPVDSPMLVKAGLETIDLQSAVAPLGHE